MTTHRPSAVSPARRALLVGVGLLAVAGTVAACSSGSKPAAAAGSATPSPGSRSGNGAGFTFPGTSGTIAAASPGSLEVQNPTAGQVTVTYTASTTFTTTVPTTLGAVTAGECVTASATPPVGTSPSPNASRTPGATRPTSFSATTVLVSTPTSGGCTTGFGGAGGGAGGAAGGGPSGFPSGRPSGARSGGGFGGGGFGGGGFGERASGTVSGVAGDVLTIAVPARGSQAASTDTITTSSSTVFTTTVAGTSTDAVVGRCATAIGKADDTGTVAATRIALSTPGASGCTTGFGGRGAAGGGSTTGA